MATANDSPVDYKNLLLDLLADMHGDGGHYALKHGVKKAVEDALEKFYNTKSTLRDLLEERKTKSTTLPWRAELVKDLIHVDQPELWNKSYVTEEYKVNNQCKDQGDLTKDMVIECEHCGAKMRVI